MDKKPNRVYVFSKPNRTRLSSDYPRYLIYWIVGTALLVCACSKDTTPPAIPAASLFVEGSSCTETWLTLRAEAGQEVTITRDDTVTIFDGTLIRADTLLNDGGLSPSHSYRYEVSIFHDENIHSQVSAIATTLDTSSHNFTVKIDTIGSTSTILHDVAIISEDNIWAVGSIHTEETDQLDSLGNWVHPYNAAHWNGTEWELKRVFYGSFPWEINSIFAFSADDIWFDAFVQWDGTTYRELLIPDIILGHSVHKTWGSSSSNMYVVGSDGLIAYYDGRYWEELESGTDLPILDIWGGYDSNTDDYFILCPASGPPLGERKLLQIHADKTVTEIVWPNQERRLHSTWFQDASNVFLCGAGIFLRNRLDQYSEYTEVPLITTNVIRGQEINDLFAAGHFGILAHYNGIDWQEYVGFNDVDVFRDLAYTEDLVVAVGSVGNQGIIYTLQRF